MLKLKMQVYAINPNLKKIYKTNNKKNYLSEKWAIPAG